MKSEDQITKEFNEFWWSDNYHLCKQCIYNCKQSHKIVDMNCKKFERKENENN